MAKTSYHRYTDEELNYIRDHRYDSIDDVAETLGVPKGTVRIYMNQFRNGTFIRKPHRSRYYYAVYLQKTDELVCSGTAQECADALGIGIRAFYMRVFKSQHGITKKWDIYVDDCIDESEFE